ncbi:MAG: M1 family aminopeptidase, partial [Pseudobdellovibrionaceae bacterium]
PQISKDSLRQAEFIRDLKRFSQEAPREYDVLEYELNGQFNWDTGLLAAVVKITLRRPPTLTEIELDSEVSRLSRVRLGDGTELPYVTGESTVTIKIPESIKSENIQILVDYEVNGDSQGDGHRYRDNLAVVWPRKGDPAKSRVIYTHSEPRGAPVWMPCNDRPADRARFKTEFRMASDEQFVANGRLLKDQVKSGERVVSYVTDQAIPTYLMAFAQGEFVSATRQHGALPVSVWARRGVQVDWQKILDETVRQISHFEKLLTPYPWEKYTIVLLPNFGGGMEHASITFNEEMASTQAVPGDFGLMAHELAHQWFGDLVTVKTWDDLWIKEGMATLLAADAMRSYEDQNNTGALMGDYFWIKNGEAVRDRELPPEEKYGTGPYTRAAWYYTQIRAAVGESHFWGTLKGLLETHAYGAISSEEMIEAFRPALGEALYQKTLAALDAHELPQVRAKFENNELSLSLEDKENVLLQPIQILQKNVNGTQSSQSLVSGSAIMLKREAGVLTIVDPNDIHPTLDVWIRDDSESKESNSIWKGLGSLTTPADSSELALFKTLPPTALKFALNNREDWHLTPEELYSLYQGLPSEMAKFLILPLACHQTSIASDENRASWKSTLEFLMQDPPTVGMRSVTWSPLRTICKDVLPSSLKVRLSLVRTRPSSENLKDSEILFLHALPVEDALTTWSPLFEQGRSVRGRTIALDAIVAGARDASANKKDTTEYKAFFRRILPETEIQVMLFSLLPAILELKDRESFGAIAQVVKSTSIKVIIRKLGICTARGLSEGDEKAWQEFLTLVGSPDRLPSSLQETLLKPDAECKDF